MSRNIASPWGVSSTTAKSSLQQDLPLLTGGRPSLTIVSPTVNLLIVLIFLADLLTPFLIWKVGLPSILRWTSDFATLLVVGILFVRMFVFDRFPAGFWAIAALSILGFTQATLQGQDPLTTLWGWWKTFQFPLLAIYAYLNPHWPAQFPRQVRWLCAGVLLFEVLVQIGQYATGEPIGDNLAGTFGRNGVSQLLLFAVIAVSYALGYGVTKGDWRLFLGVFALGIVSSVLAENKIFPVATLLLTGIAVCVYLYLGGKFVQLVPYGALLLTGLALFFVGYNLFVPAAERRPLQQYLLDSEARESYNQRVRESSDDAATDYNIGRTFAVEFGWKFITTYPDQTVFLLGLGLGARTESITLGADGIAFGLDGLGLTRGTGVLVLLQEMGFLGVLAFASFILWLSYQLLVDLKRYPQSKANELRVGVLLFTLLWPMWLWYKPVIWVRVAMLLYWLVVGYVFRHRAEDRAQQVPNPSPYTAHRFQPLHSRSA